MKIAIDARALSWSGIGRYTSNLIKHLAATSPGHRYTVLVSARDRRRFEQLNAALPRPCQIVTVDGSYYSWREQTTFLYQLDQLNVDLVHFTHFNVPLFYRRPYVATIHDITRFIFPGARQQSLLQQLAYEYLFANTLRRARAIITVSNTTARDIATLPLPRPHQQTTIYEGIDPRFHEPVTDDQRHALRQHLKTTDPYVLIVGVWMHHKNIKRAIAAFGAVRTHHPGLKLIITGQPQSGYQNVPQLVQKQGLGTHVIFPGRVPDTLMPALYAESEALLFPSLYEGFGLPALEATAVGTPVITSHVSSLPEIIGESAYYVNPEHVPSITAGITTVLTNQALRQRLAAAAKERTASFSWAGAAKKHIEVYAQAAAETKQTANKP